ncbi:MAG: cell division protein [Sphingomonadales bacterium]|nr:cell division protein [Sphingomonadales bacterium]
MPDLFSRHLGGEGGHADIIPQSRLSGPIPWVIAIMVTLMLIAAGGGLALRNTGRAATAELSGGITVQIVEARTDERDRQARAALAALARMPGVGEARIVPQGELDALVEPWLGGPDETAMGEGAIPVPALIDARLAGGLSPERLAQVQAALRATAPSARVDAQSTWLGPVFGAIASLQWLSLALILVLSLATGAAVLLAARTALGNNRATIEIVHLLGGTDAQIARIFQRSIARDAMGGALAGTGAAVVVLLLLGRSFAALQAGIVTGGALGWADAAVLLVVPVAAVVLATLTARWTVIGALKGML